MQSHIDLSNDLLLKLTIWGFWGIGVLQSVILFAAIAVIFFVQPEVTAGMSSEEATLMMVVVGVVAFFFAFCVGGGFLAAWGLGKRKRWAWIVALLVGALYIPNTCLPFGAMVLVTLLRGGFKDAYDKACDEAM